MQLWASPLRAAGGTSFIFDEGAQTALVYPDTIRLSGLSRVDLGQTAKIDLDIDLIVAEATLSSFPSARRIRLVDNRPSIEPKDARARVLSVTPAGREWAFSVSLLFPLSLADDMIAALRSDVEWLGILVKGTTEQFQTSIVVAIYDFGSELLSRITDVESASGQITLVRSELSKKLDLKYVDELTDRMLAEKQGTLDFTDGACRIILDNIAEFRAEARRLQDRDEVIQVSDTNFRFVEVLP